jgi:hypothetical protein
MIPRGGNSDSMLDHHMAQRVQGGGEMSEMTSSRSLRSTVLAARPSQLESERDHLLTQAGVTPDERLGVMPATPFRVGCQQQSE